jgi:hypothetical protein
MVTRIIGDDFNTYLFSEREAEYLLDYAPDFLKCGILRDDGTFTCNVADLLTIVELEGMLTEKGFEISTGNKERF